MAKDGIKPGERFDYRRGVADFPGWDGMRLDGDPGTIPRNSLALALNVRANAGNWQARPGIREIIKLPNSFGTTGPGTISWLGMHHLQYNPPKLWLGSYGCIGVGTEPGAFLEWFNPDKSPEIQSVANFISETDRVPVIAPFDGNMLFGDWAILHKPMVLEPMRGESIVVSTRQSYTEQLLGIAGYEITAMQEFDGQLFVALRDPAGAASEVARWDGITLTRGDLSTTTTYGLNFCVWRDSKLVMVQSGTATVKIRDLDGTWANVTLPGAIGNTNKNSMAEFRDKIYIAEGQAVYVLSNFDSPTAATGRTLPTYSVCTSVAVLGDNLFYLYNDTTNAPPYPVWLGLYEPDLAANNWVDTYKQIDFANPNRLTWVGFAPGASSLAAYRNKLYIGGANSTLLTHTLVGDPTSTWWVVRTGGLAKQYIAVMRVGG